MQQQLFLQFGFFLGFGDMAKWLRQWFAKSLAPVRIWVSPAFDLKLKVFYLS